MINTGDGPALADLPRPDGIQARFTWVQHVAVEIDELATELQVACSRPLEDQQRAVAQGIAEHLRRANDAAFRRNPVAGRWRAWLTSTLVEAAYRNLHTATAQMVYLSDEFELEAKLPIALARARYVLQPGDPRLLAVESWKTEPMQLRRARLHSLITATYEALDRQQGQLRNFGRIILMSGLVTLFFLIVTTEVVSLRPSILPLCFPNQVISASQPSVVTHNVGLNCPTRSETDSPTGGDILIVALMGAIGGTLGATVSVRKLRGTSTPYDVPLALALLKLPLGALTAILALVLIRGDVVPGLSVLDSQGQILAYAVVFGFAQQGLTRLLDQRAESLIESLPGGEVPPARSRTTPRVNGRSRPESAEASAKMSESEAAT